MSTKTLTQAQQRRAKGLATLRKHIYQLTNASSLNDAEQKQLLRELSKVKILTRDTANTKTAKSAESEWDIVSDILHFHSHRLPESIMGIKITKRPNFCPDASNGCITWCLLDAGRGGFDDVVKLGRMRRTLWFIHFREHFLAKLTREIINGKRRAAREGKSYALRLNGTSDLPWENIMLPSGKNPFETFPEIQFYDYTASYHRLDAIDAIANYYVDFSAKENNWEECEKALQRGYNVAVPIDKEIPEFKGYPVKDGDKDDLHFAYGMRSVVFRLSPKGKLTQDTTGFLHRVA